MALAPATVLGTPLYPPPRQKVCEVSVGKTVQSSISYPAASPAASTSTVPVSDALKAGTAIVRVGMLHGMVGMVGVGKPPMRSSRRWPSSADGSSAPGASSSCSRRRRPRKAAQKSADIPPAAPAAIVRVPSSLILPSLIWILTVALVEKVGVEMVLAPMPSGRVRPRENEPEEREKVTCARRGVWVGHGVGRGVWAEGCGQRGVGGGVRGGSS